jgi:hypothetical protein
VETSLVDSLLFYIVGYLQEQGADTSTTRVVKMLYLLDVEHYRSFGRPATDLQWICYKYGPYVMDLPSYFRRLDLDLDYEESVSQSGRQRRSFSLKIPR